MDAWAHYRHLLTLGRSEFLAAAAPAALVRYGAPAREQTASGATTQTTEQRVVGRMDGAGLHGTVGAEPTDMEIYPVAKKPGASFRDRITIGRTSNNDVVITDHSVSRLHAYLRGGDGRGDGWIIADAGSKNGTWLDDVQLEPRREVAVPSGAVLRLGDVVATFCSAEHLFDLLGGDHGRR